MRVVGTDPSKRAMFKVLLEEAGLRVFSAAGSYQVLETYLIDEEDRKR